MFLTNLKQICNLCLIKFSENQSAPKLENRKTSPCSPCTPNLLHVLVSRIPGYHNLCSPVHHHHDYHLPREKADDWKSLEPTLGPLGKLSPPVDEHENSEDDEHRDDHDTDFFPREKHLRPSVTGKEIILTRRFRENGPNNHCPANVLWERTK